MRYYTCTCVCKKQFLIDATDEEDAAEARRELCRELNAELILEEPGDDR